jgi:hypothetical protein
LINVATTSVAVTCQVSFSVSKSSSSLQAWYHYFASGSCFDSA